MQKKEERCCIFLGRKKKKKKKKKEKKRVAFIHSKKGAIAFVHRDWGGKGIVYGGPWQRNWVSLGGGKSKDQSMLGYCGM